MKLHQPRQPASLTLSEMLVRGTSGNLGCLKFVVVPLVYVFMALTYSVEVFLRFRIGELYIHFSRFFWGIVLIFLYQAIQYSNYTLDGWLSWFALLFDSPLQWITSGRLLVIAPALLGFLVVAFVIGLGHHVLARWMRQRQGAWGHPHMPGESWLFLPLKSRFPEWTYKQVRFFGEPVIVFLIGVLLSLYSGYFLFGGYLKVCALALAIKGACHLNIERHRRLSHMTTEFDPITRERFKGRSRGKKSKSKGGFVVQTNPELKKRKH